MHSVVVAGTMRLWEVILEGEAGFKCFILEKTGNHLGFLRKGAMEASCVGLLRSSGSSEEGWGEPLGGWCPSPGQRGPGPQ